MPPVKIFPKTKKLSIRKPSTFAAMNQELAETYEVSLQKIKDQEVILTSQGQHIANLQAQMHGEWSWRGKLNELVLLLKRRLEKDGKDCRCNECRDTVMTLDRQGIIFRDEATADALIGMAWKPWEK